MRALAGLEMTVNGFKLNSVINDINRYYGRPIFVDIITIHNIVHIRPCGRRVVAGLCAGGRRHLVSEVERMMSPIISNRSRDIVTPSLFLPYSHHPSVVSSARGVLCGRLPCPESYHSSHTQIRFPPTSGPRPWRQGSTSLS
jgi:hypothetical protein